VTLEGAINEVLGEALLALANIRWYAHLLNQEEVEEKTLALGGRALKRETDRLEQLLEVYSTLLCLNEDEPTTYAVSVPVFDADERKKTASLSEVRT